MNRNEYEPFTLAATEAQIRIASMHNQGRKEPAALIFVAAAIVAVLCVCKVVMML